MKLTMLSTLLAAIALSSAASAHVVELAASDQNPVQFATVQTAAAVSKLFTKEAIVQFATVQTTAQPEVTVQQHPEATVQGTVQAASQSRIADEDATVQGVTAAHATTHTTLQPTEQPAAHPTKLMLASEAQHELAVDDKWIQNATGLKVDINSRLNNIMTVQQERLFNPPPLLPKAPSLVYQLPN